MEEKLRKIMKYFGMKRQLDKLREESEEYLESDYDPSEVADIFVVVSQVYLHSPVVRGIVEQKIERTLERIKNNYYEGEIA